MTLAVLVFHLGVDQHRGEIVARIVEPGIAELVGVGAQLFHHPHPLADGQAVGGIGDTEEVHQRGEQPGLVGVGDAEQPADHLQRQECGERVDQIEVRDADQWVEQRDRA